MVKRFMSGILGGLLVLSGRSACLGVLVAAGLVAGVTDAEARLATSKFKPPYGEPFPGLDFFGEVKVDDGDCNSNYNFSGCGGSMSIVSATLNFGPIQDDIDDTPPAWQTITFSRDENPQDFGQVLSIDRTSVDSWQGVRTSAFRAKQGTIGNADNHPDDPLTMYDPPGNAPPKQAWFSLIFVGTTAQVMWFENDPGAPILSYMNDVPFSELSGQYLACFLAAEITGRSVNRIPGNRCGLSSWNDGEGAPLLDENGNPGFTLLRAVPEPSSLIMALSGLAAVGFMTPIARRRSNKNQGS